MATITLLSSPPCCSSLRTAGNGWPVERWLAVTSRHSGSERWLAVITPLQSSNISTGAKVSRRVVLLNPRERVRPWRGVHAAPRVKSCRGFFLPTNVAWHASLRWLCMESCRPCRVRCERLLLHVSALIIEKVPMAENALRYRIDISQQRRIAWRLHYATQDKSPVNVGPLATSCAVHHTQAMLSAQQCSPSGRED